MQFLVPSRSIGIRKGAAGNSDRRWHWISQRREIMAETSPRRVYLSDLVMAVLFCGTVVAAFTAPWDSRDKITIAAGVVGIVWYFIRQMRSAPTCEVCGARFFPQKAADAATSCPHCGEPQAPLRQPSVRGGVILCLIGLLIAIFAISIFAFALARPGNDPCLRSRGCQPC